MNSLRIINRPFAVLFALAFIFSSCQDESFLNTENLNQPDESRALASSADVEALIKGSVISYFASHDYGGYEHLLVSSDVMTCSWGNAMMKLSSSEPRVELPNTTTYSYAYAIENNWYRMYRAISSANDGLRAISSGMQIGENGADNERAKAFAYLVQGMAHGLLACFYDKAFIFDDSLPHEVKHEGKLDRIVLIVDIWPRLIDLETKKFIKSNIFWMKQLCVLEN